MLHKQPSQEKVKRSAVLRSKVQELLRTFSRVANPFTFDRTSDVNEKYPLMNICSGVVMPNEDAEKLLQASLIGEQKIGKDVSKKFKSTITFFAKI